MKYKALVSFSGKVSMAMDEVGEIADKSIADDLLRAGYIIEFKEYNPNAPKVEEAKPKKKKGGK